MFRLASLLLLVGSVTADVACKTPGGIAPCIMEIPGLHACPDGNACFVDANNDANSYCCPLTEIINDNCAPAVATTTAAPAAGCQDKANPNTGVSDCPRLAYLCNDPGYYQLMTDQCPKTCNRCPGTGGVTPGPAPACVDKANPTTGVSDCPNRKDLCQNPIYEPLMRDQCPRTCGFCK